MNYRHKPLTDTRQIPQTAVDIQQLVSDLRTIVPEGEQPDVKITIVCNYCGTGKSYMMDREAWIDNYAPETVIDEICYYCGMDIEEGIQV
jgi:hypothetical protein